AVAVDAPEQLGDLLEGEGVGEVARVTTAVVVPGLGEQGQPGLGLGGGGARGALPRAGREALDLAGVEDAPPPVVRTPVGQATPADIGVDRLLLDLECARGFVRGQPAAAVALSAHGRSPLLCQPG